MLKITIKATCLSLGAKTDWTDYNFAQSAFAEFLRRKYQRIVDDIADYGFAEADATIKLDFDPKRISRWPIIEVESDILSEEEIDIIATDIDSLFPAYFGLFQAFIKRPDIARIYVPSIEKMAA